MLGIARELEDSLILTRALARQSQQHAVFDRPYVGFGCVKCWDYFGTAAETWETVCLDESCAVPEIPLSL